LGLFRGPYPTRVSNGCGTNGLPLAERKGYGGKCAARGAFDFAYRDASTASIIARLT
jgi:hypothetical protein